MFSGIFPRTLVALHPKTLITEFCVEKFGRETTILVEAEREGTKQIKEDGSPCSPPENKTKSRLSFWRRLKREEAAGKVGSARQPNG